MVDNRKVFYLLPENLPVYMLWWQVQSQWLYGMAGPTGLNWQSLRQHPAVLRIPRRRRAGLLEGIADMESAWLAERARIAAEKRSPTR